MTDSTLSTKEQRFALEFVVDMSAPDAAERAGFPRNKGSQLIKKPGVKKRIEDELSIIRTQNHATIERCAEEYAKLAFSNITDAITWGTEDIVNDDDVVIDTVAFVELMESEDLPAEVRAAIKSVKQTANGVAIEFYDKKAALDSIMRHLGGFNDNVTVTPGGELGKLLEAATNQGHKLPSAG